MQSILSTVFYVPLYNGLIFFISVLPYHNVGLAVILFTCIIKLILFPLSQQSVKTQFAMKQLEPKLAEIKIKYKDDRTAQAEKTMDLYKQNGVNPFSGVLLMILQIPVLISLYYVFLKGGLPAIDHNILYSFTRVPNTISMVLFGVNVFNKNVLFAVAAAVAQFFQMQLMLPKSAKKTPEQAKNPSFQDELARSMNMQMKYVMPILIFFIAQNFPVVVSLYLITSSLFAVGQELYVRRTNKSTKSPAVNV